MINKLSKAFFIAAGLLVLGSLVSASIDIVQGATVTVSATVGQTVSCSTDITSTAFGTLTTGAVSTATSNASSSLSCNTGLGCALTIQDAGNGSSPGLATSSPAYLIPSNTATLVAGTEGYGIQATTTAAGSGGTLTIRPIYNVTSTDVGALSLSAITLASSTSQIANRQVVVRHLAAISGTTQSGSYSDTITYSCTGN